MLIIRNKINDPYFNIASEEYLLKSFDDDIFMLYINEPSIIVGKHQNTLAEINYCYVKENNISVIRRISGGGTVFHDLGNVNFLFIKNGRDGHLVDFKGFTEPIIEVLQSLGIDARFEGKNDIRVNGLKISGNAEHVFKNRTLHHGTLLFSSNLDFLNEAIRVDADKYQSKAVQSNRSNVTNIALQLASDLSIDRFMDLIYNQIEKKQNCELYEWSDNDWEAIIKLKEEKYETWDWNYGYSTQYTITREIKIDHEELLFKLTVDKGIIIDVFVKTSLMNEELALLSLKGCKHKEEDMLHKLEQTNSGRLKEFVFELF